MRRCDACDREITDEDVVVVVNQWGSADDKGQRSGVTAEYCEGCASMMNVKIAGIDMHVDLVSLAYGISYHVRRKIEKAKQKEVEKA